MSNSDRSKTLNLGDVTMQYSDLGCGRPVLLAHGFPDTGYSWRHQVPVLLDAGYRVIVPDMPGYGGTSAPSDIEAYSAERVGGALIDLLDALDVGRVAIVSHDWGAATTWPLGLTHVDRVAGIFGMSVPHSPPPSAAPLGILRSRLGETFYMAALQPLDEPERVLESNVRGVLTNAYASQDFLGDVPQHERPDWMSAEELDTYVETFARTGFRGGVNYYRNIDRNWVYSLRCPTTSPVPVHFLTGSADPVKEFSPADRLTEVFPDLRGSVEVPGAGHWVHQERPAEVNKHLLTFLGSLDWGRNQHTQ